MRLFILTILLIFTGSLLVHSQVRTFRNQFGQSFPAEIVDVRGDTVVMELPGGTRESMPIASLSTRDQRYVREWEEARLIGRQLRITIEPQSSTTPEREHPFRQGGYELPSYTINLQNAGSRALPNIRLVYRFHYRETDPQGRTGGIFRVHEEETLIPQLRGNQREQITTRTLPLRRFSLVDGFTPIGPPTRQFNDELLGLEVLVFSNDSRTNRVTYPTDLDSRLRR